MRVFEGQVKDHVVGNGRGARTIRFHLHGAFFGDFVPAPCFKTRRITGKPFPFRI
jgi:hypothetical protein